MASTFIGKVLDNYRILGSLGEGGMGMVFKAVNIQLDKVVALKMIAAGMAMDKRFIDRFRTEARALAKLEDPNIVAIHDLRSYNDLWFIVMEYVDGANLYNIIKKQGAIPWQEALKIVKQMLSGLGHAHRAGIIHRDIKPNNIMINKDGVVKITDFGLAKDQTNAYNTMTIAGGGTLYYMSPEHLKGFSFTDKRSDIYSLGMTFYEMLTGKVPFENINTDFEIRETIIRKDLKKPSTYITDLPDALEEIVMKSIAKDPDERYQSCEDMLQAIRLFEVEQGISDTSTLNINLNGLAATGKSPSEKQTGDKKAGYKKRLKIVIPAIALFVALVAAGYYARLFSAKKNTPPATTYLSLKISTSPSGAFVFINGDSLGRTPLQNHTLRKGTYRLHVSKDDYEAKDTTVVLENAHIYDFAFILNPLKKENETSGQIVVSQQNKKVTEVRVATMAIRSKPSGADLWLNGKLIGRTPVQKNRLKPGSYQIKLIKEGFEAYSGLVQLNAGEKRDLNITLTPLRGTLHIETEPPGARVRIDGQEIPNRLTPFTYGNLREGVHRILVQKEGYAAHQSEVEINHSQNAVKKIVLTPLQGTLSVRVIPWGTIYIDDQIQKTSTDVKYEIKLPVGKHVLRVMHPTLGEWTKTISIPESGIKSFKINFHKKIPIMINAKDDNGNQLNADVYIDGEKTEQKTPTRVELRVGIHRLLVKLSGYSMSGGELRFLVDSDAPTKQSVLLRKIN